MYCKQCGSQVNEGAKFCGVCGTPTVAAEATPEDVAANSRHTFYAPQSTGIGTIEFITSYITFYLKGSIEFTNDNVIAQVPNTILGVIPLGRRKRTLDVAHITSTVSDFKVDIKKLLIGAVIALVGLCSLGDPDSILLALAIMAFGVLMVLNALVSYVAISMDSGELVIIPLVVFERDKADMIAAKVNISSDTKKADTGNTGNNTRFMLRAKALGHPLMHRDRCVRNDIDMEKRPFFIIITGANMAGKSTYLRTIGINYLLACTGMPVCAEEMEAYPARLITSLRTSDSLTDNESYFFAELKRLKLIIDKLHSGEELFIILDEILKGTNSMDKQKGSFALIKQFMALQANGIIATHDLLLGTLIDLFPGNICNYRFEADITDNELTFSYRLRPGVAQNMNACFLMKKMGIAVAD